MCWLAPKWSIQHNLCVGYVILWWCVHFHVVSNRLCSLHLIVCLVDCNKIGLDSKNVVKFHMFHGSIVCVAWKSFSFPHSICLFWLFVHEKTDLCLCAVNLFIELISYRCHSCSITHNHVPMLHPVYGNTKQITFRISGWILLKIKTKSQTNFVKVEKVIEIVMSFPEFNGISLKQFVYWRDNYEKESKIEEMRMITHHQMIRLRMRYDTTSQSTWWKATL